MRIYKKLMNMKNVERWRHPMIFVMKILHFVISHQIFFAKQTMLFELQITALYKLPRVYTKFRQLAPNKLMQTKAEDINLTPPTK